jgi:serine/threonine protein kinase
MSPEQLEGKETDARSDIFSFGAMLYEMITGRKGFEGSSHASLIAAVMSANPPPVSTIQPMASPALDRLVRKCLAKFPDDRWQSAGDLLSRHSRARRGQTSQSRTPRVAGRWPGCSAPPRIACLDRGPFAEGNSRSRNGSFPDTRTG